MGGELEGVTVVGAGLMGTTFALDWARSGHGVAFYDADSRRVRTLPERARRVGAALVSAELIDHGELEAAVCRLEPRPDLAEALAGAAYVAEAIVEDLPAKQALYAELDSLCPPETVFASSTSTLMPSDLALAMRWRERLLIAHYFNPAHLIPVVEVVLGPETGQAALDLTCRLLRRAGKSPAVLRKDVPGFIANRLQAALLCGALHLVQEGVCSPEDLDAVVSLGFGRRFAAFRPLILHDMAGLDVRWAIATNLFPLLSNAVEPPAALAERAGRGEFGLKTGRGIFAWPAERAQAALADRAAILLRLLHGSSAELQPESEGGAP